jgi:DNA invertase Pin-like site-specific DNA recombinase
MEMNRVTQQSGIEPVGPLLRGEIYARSSVSSDDSINRQISTCANWARLNGIEVDHEFADYGPAERSVYRPALDDLRRGIAAGEFDVLLVIRSDRLCRSIEESSAFIHDEIVARGLRCVFLDQGTVIS